MKPYEKTSTELTKEEILYMCRNIDLGDGDDPPEPGSFIQVLRLILTSLAERLPDDVL